MFGTGLGGLLSGIVFTWGVTIYAEKSCYGNGGSLVLSLKNIGEAGTGEGVCTNCIGDDNIFSIAQILA